MIGHNLNLAWRQLIKYRLQSAVSIVSLAIGFACFALASMWIKYETTYDAFHKDAEHLHAILEEGNEMSIHFDPHSLRELPQMEKLSHIQLVHWDSINGFNYGFEWVMNDTNFVELFGPEIMEGTTEFVYNEHEVAISDRLARKIWGDESPIGKELNCFCKNMIYRDRTFRHTRRVGAVFRNWGNHSNYGDVDILSQRSTAFPDFVFFHSKLFAHIPSYVNLEALNAHLDTVALYPADASKYKDMDATLQMKTFGYNKLKAIPIMKVRHQTEQYEKYSKVKINHIYLFSIASALLIACGLLNYLTMFINRLFIRKREIALRSVFGATSGKLMVQFLTEYGLLLLIALFCGIYVVQVSLDWFLEMSGLPKDWDFFHRESLVYMLVVFVVSILISMPFIWYFRRQSLQSSITGVGGLMKYNLFRRISTGVQIGISMFCIFCTVVLMKQLDHLSRGDIGFERENRMMYSIHSNTRGMEEEITSFLRQCPEVDTAFYCINPIYPLTGYSSSRVYPDEYPHLTEPFNCYNLFVTSDLVQFYGLTLLEGRWLRDGERDAIMVNETLVRKIGWENPLGEHFMRGTIVGVVKDFQNASPTVRAEAYVLRDEYSSPSRDDYQKHIVFRYKPGMKQALLAKVETFFKERDLSYNDYQWTDMTEEYGTMLQTENNLQTLISVTTGVCILIALFGVWSMIMLTCEQRRKEIAIRKVYGATTKDILDMFFTEYMTLQGIAAIVAFPMGYACMKPWLEQYVVQTEISWWIYVGIFLMVALLVALCVGWRVWKTAKARPADEICKG